MIITKNLIVGIDEVGRGCWAGPLVAAAVLLKQPIAGLRDSKKLTALQRQSLDQLLRGSEDVIFGIGWVLPGEVDKLGLTKAVALAMQRALDEITEPYSEVIIDGNYNFLPDVRGSRTMVRADDTVPAVSAASIIAKVARDNYMQKLAHYEFPDYGFDTHVGYGTKQHIAALAKHGITKYHRRSYKPIRALLEVNA